VNENKDLVDENPRYVMQITGDNDEGKAQLDNFIDPRSQYPTLVTTSELLTTGVDAKTCKLIVLDQRIQSMTKFKQIIGRGTRLDERYGKQFFTIMDFKQATKLFADPDFDGEPVQIYEPKPDKPIVPPDPPEPGGAGDDGEDESEPCPRPEKYVVTDAEVGVAVVREMHYGKDGQLVTESIRDYTRTTVSQEYASLDEFLRKWNAADKKQAIIQELEEQGLLLDALEQEVGKDYDAFDLICHVVFDQPPLTRRERANNVRKRDYFSRYGEQARQVLENLLEKYADEGIEDIEDLNVLKVAPFTEIGTPVEIIQAFGGRDSYLDALQRLSVELYRAS
jgi:type I restriction enzyme R subunit